MSRRSARRTPDGKRLVETILPEHLANEERLLAGLSSKTRADLAHLLESLAVSLGDGTARVHGGKDLVGGGCE